jgi:hypothetical protein
MTKRDFEPLITASDARSLVGSVVSLRAIYAAMTRGELKSVRIGRRCYTRRTWVAQWIEKRQKLKG